MTLGVAEVSRRHGHWKKGNRELKSQDIVGLEIIKNGDEYCWKARVNQTGVCKFQK